MAAQAPDLYRVLTEYCQRGPAQKTACEFPQEERLTCVMGRGRGSDQAMLLKF
jgi:hypothetical protein